MLREQNVDPKEFDEIMKRLKELDSERVYQNVDELARLQTFVAEGLKRFEYALRRKVGDDTDRALVNGSEEVPAEFKALVEEYYRSLSKGKAKQ
jgi:tetrahydromethanopterin S-methyltransferase subunit G